VNCEQARKKMKYLSERTKHLISIHLNHSSSSTIDHSTSDKAPYLYNDSYLTAATTSTSFSSPTAPASPTSSYHTSHDITVLKSLDQLDDILTRKPIISNGFTLKRIEAEEESLTEKDKIEKNKVMPIKPRRRLSARLLFCCFADQKRRRKTVEVNLDDFSSCSTSLDYDQVS
jgi:hypothetical protein